MMTGVVLMTGTRVVLRDPRPEDVEAVIEWNRRGEHLRFDAPWERPPDPPTAEALDRLRAAFLERCRMDSPTPRGSALIATPDGRPIGAVNRYVQRELQDAPFIGVSVKLDEFLNQGLGTEAFRLWLDYQFERSEARRIGCETWSFNPRAARVAEKVGFKLEGVQREFREWDGRPLDKLLFGMLRREWEARRDSTETGLR